MLQETNGGGAGGRETGRESADAVPAGRGPRQSGVPDDSVRASWWHASVQFGQQAAVVGDGIDPSWGGSMGLPLRPTAASRRANLLKRDDVDLRESLAKWIVFAPSSSSHLRPTKIRSERKAGTKSRISKSLVHQFRSMYIPFLHLLHEISERRDAHSAHRSIDIR